MSAVPTGGGAAGNAAHRPPRRRMYLAPEARVMFVSVNKNACTSLQWMMAGLAGEDLEGFRPGLAPFVSDLEAVHNRHQWTVSPRYDELDPATKAQVHPDGGWFVFAVTRDPRGRLFSAWQNKLLLENPGYTGWRGEPWYPRHPLDSDSVIADFAAFVDLLERDPQHPFRVEDPHFRDQVDLLWLDRVTYSRIYDIREIDQLREDLTRHLEAVGWTRGFDLPMINDTPLRSTAAPFADGVRERVERIYSADFARFGSRWDFGRVEAAPPWSETELAEAESRATYGKRIGELRDAALTQRDRARAAQRRAEKQAARVVAERARADRLRRRNQILAERLQGRGDGI